MIQSKTLPVTKRAWKSIVFYGPRTRPFSSKFGLSNLYKEHEILHTLKSTDRYLFPGKHYYKNKEYC